MSSLRNSVYRRNHAERSQELKRSHLGLLEKKKDYKLRAKDYHRKQDALKKLREKARFRNEDEFYFKMINTGTKGGVHIKERTDVLGADVMKILRTQDLGYIIRQRTIEMKKIERLRNELHFIDDELGEERDEIDEESDEELGEKIDEEPALVKKHIKHTVFVDDQDEVDSFDPAKHFNTAPELVHQKHNRIPLDVLKKKPLETTSFTEDEKKALASQRKLLYKELRSRLERLEKLNLAARESEIQKALLGKGKREKIGKDALGLPIYRFASERKK